MKKVLARCSSYSQHLLMVCSASVKCRWTREGMGDAKHENKQICNNRTVDVKYFVPSYKLYNLY